MQTSSKDKNILQIGRGRSLLADRNEAAGRGGKRTRHAWSFKLSDTEARGLASPRAAVSRPSAQDDPSRIRQFDKQPAVVAKPCRPQVKPRDDGAKLRRLKGPPRPPGE